MTGDDFSIAINFASRNGYQIVYRKNDRSHHASALTRVTKRGEAYLIEGSRMAGETRIAFGDALLFALDMAAKVEQFRSG